MARSGKDHEGQRMRAGRNVARPVGLWLGPALFTGLLLFADFVPGEPAVTRMAAVAALMAVWWITDAIPLAATALLPLVLFPLMGIMSGKATAPIYVNNIIFLFVGGFMIALAMEKWNLHKRIALWIIRLVGGGPGRLVLSFMLASAFLSMWISNTATAIMMLAIGLAIIKEEEEAFGKERTGNLSIALLLGIAYGSSVGGVATLVGTPPNLSFARIFAQTFPDAPAISFGQWMLLGLPLTAVMLLVIWLLLTRVFFRSPPELRLSSEVIRREYAALGVMRFAERAVLAVFVGTAFLWVFRKDLALGDWVVPGWSRLLPTADLLDDGTVAIGMALVLFLIPSRARLRPASGETSPGQAGQAVRSVDEEDHDEFDEDFENPGGRILDLEVFRKIPWNIVLLFGGGFALAKGFQETGLASFIGGHFEDLAGASPVVMIATICSLLTFLTELTSNTATTEMILPILASVAVTMETNPLLLMIPATLSASCAFMMPVATPPNAIVFGSGRIRIGDMVKAGIVINLVGIAVITTLFWVLGRWVFHIDPGEMPAWAK